MAQRAVHRHLLTLSLILAATIPALFAPPGRDDARAAIVSPASLVSVVVSEDGPTSFTFEGRPYTARLRSITGESAVVRFSEQTADVILSTTQDESVDLTDDTVPDATASLAAVDGAAHRVTIEIASLATGAWNESGFKTAGGVRPWDVNSANGSISSALVSDGRGGLMLFTIAANRSVAWQRYSNDGTFSRAPLYGAGLLPNVSDRYRTNTLDAVSVPKGFVVATELRLYGGTTNKGVALVPYNKDLEPIGPPLMLGGYRPRLAYDGHDIWLVTTDRTRLSISQISVGTTLTLKRTLIPIDPPGTRKDGQPDIAVNAGQNRVVVTWGRFGGGAAGEVRLAVLDRTTGALVRQTHVATGLAGDGYSARWDAPDVLVAGTSATVLWHYGTPDRVHSAKVDLGTGGITQRTSQKWLGITGAGPLTGELVLAKIGSSTRLVGLLVGAVQIGSTTVARYRAYKLRADGFDRTGAVTLEGGFPIRADVLVDLSAYRQVPDQAVAGSEVVVEGAVINRGTQSARNVTVEVLIAGGVIGTVTVGTLTPFARQPVAVGYSVPADTVSEQLPLALRVRTTSAQYTTGNDLARFNLGVLQRGLINGWVIDDSADIHHTSEFSAGLAGADVAVGDTHVLTNRDGFFTVKDLPFGTYPVSASKTGYKPVSGSVTVSRTRPFGFVAMRTDDHGILELHVVDKNGQPLGGATVTIVNARASDLTPTSGVLRYDISKGSYRVAVTKRGYTPVTDLQVQVGLGETTAPEPIVLSPATAATATGRVVDEHGEGVAGATVQVFDLAASNAVIQTVTTAADGTFGPLSLPAGTSAHSYVLKAHKSGIAWTGSDQLNVYGGDVRSSLLALVPDASGDLHGVSASGGYTSWMVHAGFPGFAAIPGADMYVWYGNYGIKVSAEFWDATHELTGVDVSVQGNSYESHATKSEVDFTALQGDDFSDLFETVNIEPGLVGIGGFFADLATEHATDLIDLAGDVKDLFDPGDAVEIGQGTRLLTWKEAREDFRVIPEFDSSQPIKSVFDILVSIPTSFAIPVVIGGSSYETTSVRVDQVDVVDADTHQVLWSSETSPTTEPRSWFSWQGPDGPGGVNTKRYSVGTQDVDERSVLVEVFLTVGKTSPSTIGPTTVQGTGFDQREQQVVIFRPSTGALTAQIATGNLYRHGERIRPAAS